MAESWITNRPVGAALADWFKGANTAAAAPINIPSPLVGPQQAQAVLSGVRPGAIYSLPGFTPPDTAERIQTRRAEARAPVNTGQWDPVPVERNTGQWDVAPQPQMPRVVYGNPDPYQGLSLLAAMKMNQAAKPVSTQEQALHALGNFAQTNWARKMAAAGKETDPKKQAAIMQEADTGYQNVIEQLAFGGDAMKQFMAMAMRQARGQ